MFLYCLFYCICCRKCDVLVLKNYTIKISVHADVGHCSPCLHSKPGPSSAITPKNVRWHCQFAGFCWSANVGLSKPNI